MDIRITKKRLNDHLSYDWWKYIAVFIACIFFWSLVFTMAAPRLHASKKMELFFIVNGFSHENSNKFYNGLREYLNDEFVEFQLNNYVPNDNTTSQVLTARLSVQEGDLYAFPFAGNEDFSKNTFGSYIDNGVFKDFLSIIEEAKAFGDNIMSEDDFRQQNSGIKDYNTEEKMVAGYQVYQNTRLRAKEQALKLEGYINDYQAENLFVKYSRFSVYNKLYPEENEIVTQDEIIWGLNFNALEEKITDFNNNGFLYRNTVDSDTGIREPLNIAMGIVSFKNENMPLYYENLAVINYFIETYFL